MDEEDLKRMTFRILDRVKYLDGDIWKSVFDKESLRWYEQYLKELDPEEREELDSIHKDIEMMRS